jgi:hypothetical protein
MKQGLSRINRFTLIVFLIVTIGKNMGDLLAQDQLIESGFAFKHEKAGAFQDSINRELYEDNLKIKSEIDFDPGIDRDRAVEYGFIGKDAFSNILRVLNAKQENSNQYRCAWFLGLDFIGDKEINAALLRVSRLSFKNQFWFYQVLDQRIAQAKTRKLQDFESLAEKIISSHAVYTKGMMFTTNDYENWIQDIVRVARFKSFQSPRYANQFIRLLSHVIDNFASVYNPQETKNAIRFIVINSLADDDFKAHIILRLVDQKKIKPHLLTSRDSIIEKPWPSEVLFAVIWYMHEIKDESKTASHIWSEIVEGCKDNADWIRKVETGMINEEIGFNKPLRNSMQSKEAFLKANESARQLFSRP